MSRTKPKFTCQECGYDSPKWLGKCPGCGMWNTMVEEVVSRQIEGFRPSAANKVCPITNVDIPLAPRRKTGIGEFDGVLGGGIVPGALILLGGDPGIGKSTLLLQVAEAVARQYGEVLYVSGEESAAQTKMRATRLGTLQSNLYVLTEASLDAILMQAESLRPALMIIDSIQTMYCAEISSAPGSVAQVRESTGKLLRFAKESDVPVIIVGHVTKDGTIAGPRLLEHMVDVVLYFEGERNYVFRMLRAIKNRFGAINESGLFSMEKQGLCEVKNPSALLLAERPCRIPGSVILAYLEGVRPLLIEFQALVANTCFGMPRRTAVGFDYNRMVLLMAVLEKKVGMLLSNQDAYINAVGGIRINEPAADLAVTLAIASSFKDIAVDPYTVVMGEVGLTGEVRTVSRVDDRISEAAKLGFRRFVIPANNTQGLQVSRLGIEIIGVKDVREAMEAVFI